ncbi:MAG: carbohydrate binding domain-containing protein, partial [Acidobacteriota bacterium]|nr:carbohydrate binding domain-containing protein [Acidobacteriota bacterium]
MERKADDVQYKIFDAHQLSTRVGLILAVIAVVVFGWFAVRWQLGDMLADLTLPTDVNAKEIADLAVRLAPGDPTTNWLAASVRKNVFTTEAIDQTAKNFETVVRKSPDDYRWWVELGRAREQSEQTDIAESAFLEAVKLAPNYAYPHWQAGNFYLRQNRSEEAFNELKKTAESNSIYRDQVFSVVWDYYEKDMARMEQLAGDAPASRASLSRFYAAKQRPEDSLRIWNTLSEEDKQANLPVAKILAQSLFERKFFRQSLAFTREIGITPDLRDETVQNAGFEKPIGDGEGNYFGWTVLPVEKMEVKLDPTQKHEGNRSLRIAFSGYSEPTLYHVGQLVTVEPAAKYRLTFWTKTDSLKSGGMPAFEVYNANDTANLVTNEAFPVGTSDWHPVKLEFTAPENADAVGIRLLRLPCDGKCPILGTIWLDDFKLERIK